MVISLDDLGDISEVTIAQQEDIKYIFKKFKPKKCEYKLDQDTVNNIKISGNKLYETDLLERTSK